MGLKIELLKKVMMTGEQHPSPVGRVMEAKDGEQDAEFRALITANYAKETTAKVSMPKGKPTRLTAAAVNQFPNGKGDDAGEKFDASKPHADDEFFATTLKGNLDTVIAALDSLDANQLARLNYLESKAGGGQDRNGIEKAVAKLLAKKDA